MLNIMIFFSFSDQEQRRYHQGQYFRHNDCGPDSVYTQENGQYHNHADLEYQSPHKGNHSGSDSVAEGGEESGAPDIETTDQKGDGINPETAAGQRIELCIVTDENSGERISQCFRQKCYAQTDDSDDCKAFPEKIL